MSRKCQVTGKARQIGHRVSHSNIKTKTTNMVNIKTKKIYDPTTGQTIKVKVAASALRSLDKVGSLSKYIAKHGK
jgi:large subunit ribosomal protein L28